MRCSSYQPVLFNTHKQVFRTMSLLVVAGTILGAGLLGACASKERQLESVARDWCMTIRASQVIPVYPLSQDLQPGDIFLVQLPVDRQQEQYRRKGFLPLDNHLARLNPAGYDEFYSTSFLSGPGESTMQLPAAWLRPAAAAGGAVTPWSTAPGAAFPTYAFSVNQSQGMNVAVPVSGIPVGLSLLGSQSANGTVSIKQAKTLGVDVMSLHQQLEEWAQGESQRAFLANFGTPSNQKPRNFLRVVTRIYLTGQLDVQINAADSVAVGADVGAPRPVDNFIASPPDGPADVQRSARENYLKGISSLNNMLSERDLALHESGDDAGLSPEAAKAAREAREKYAAEQRTAAAEKLKSERENADNKKAIDEATQRLNELNTAQKSQVGARHALSQAYAKLEVAEKLPESDATHDQKIDDAKKLIATRETELADADTKLEAARLEYRKAQVNAAPATARIQSAQSALDKLQSFAPGGSVRIAAASSRSISMSESFNPPLIIGYLGFDVAILSGGVLGEPIPTHAVIAGQLVPDAGSAAATYASLNEEQLVTTLYDSIKKDTDSVRAQTLKEELDRLDRFVRIDLAPIEAVDGGYVMNLDKPFKRGGLYRYTSYRASRKSALAILAGRSNVPLTLNIIKDGVVAPANAEDISRLMEAFQTPPRERECFNNARDALLDYYHRSLPRE